MTLNQPGWYADPFQRAQTRWWSGAAWTEHVGTNGQAFIDPPGDESHAMVPHAPVPEMAPVMAAAGMQQQAAAYAAAPAVAASGRSSATKKLAIVGVVAGLALAACTDSLNSLKPSGEVDTGAGPAFRLPAARPGRSGFVRVARPTAGAQRVL